MKRKAVIVLLALGTLGGFASGFASMRCRAHGRHAYFKQQITQICADAVHRAQARP
jgi:hypothetical protein